MASIFMRLQACRGKPLRRAGADQAGQRGEVSWCDPVNGKNEDGREKV